jgi:hypothetical protein
MLTTKRCVCGGIRCCCTALAASFQNWRFDLIAPLLGSLLPLEYATTVAAPSVSKYVHIDCRPTTRRSGSGGSASLWCGSS